MPLSPLLPLQPYYSRPSLPSNAPRVPPSSTPRPVAPTHVYQPGQQMMMIPSQQIPFSNQQGPAYFIPGQVTSPCPFHQGAPSILGAIVILFILTFTIPFGTVPLVPLHQASSIKRSYGIWKERKCFLKPGLVATSKAVPLPVCEGGPTWSGLVTPGSGTDSAESVLRSMEPVLGKMPLSPSPGDQLTLQSLPDCAVLKSATEKERRMGVTVC